MQGRCATEVAGGCVNGLRCWKLWTSGCPIVFGHKGTFVFGVLPFVNQRKCRPITGTQEVNTEYTSPTEYISNSCWIHLRL